MEGIILILYMVTCFFWAVFAIVMQLRYFPTKNESWRVVLVFILNYIFCPITILIAIVTEADRDRKETKNDN